MQVVFLLLLGISSLIFLFTLYLQGKEDYPLVRKNITPEILYNLAFSGLLAGLLGARLLFVLLHPSMKYLNPLVFLLFPYFPGLSLVGALLFFLFYLYYISRLKKYPFSRLMDLFSLAFLSALPVSFLANIFLFKHSLWQTLVVAGIYLVIYVFFSKLLHKFLLKGEIKDGSIATLFFLTYSVVSLFYSALLQEKGVFYFLRSEDIVVIGVFIISFIMLFRAKK